MFGRNWMNVAPCRARIRWMVGPALLGSLTLGAAEATAQQWVPIRSGLPWASGANGGGGGMADLQAMRGRPLDFRTTFLRQDTWQGLLAGTSNVRSIVTTGAAAVVAFGMMPQTHRGQHVPCAQGQFDSYIRTFGTSLVNAGASRAVLRLGWEANRLNGFAWAVTGDGSDYKRCFRRWVSVLRSLPGQRFVVDWNMQEKSVFPIDQMYPGNDVVDVIGINVYDRCVPVRSETHWTSWLNAKHGDGRNPRGPATWLQFAKARGKKMSIPEWGIGGPSEVKACTQPGFDNPFFVRKWHAFIKANATSLAYEGYFNGHGYANDSLGSHKLAPTTYNPLSASVYRELWGPSFRP